MSVHVVIWIPVVTWNTSVLRVTFPSLLHADLALAGERAPCRNWRFVLMSFSWASCHCRIWRQQGCFRHVRHHCRICGITSLSLPSELLLQEDHTIDEPVSHQHSVHVLLQSLCTPSSVTVLVVSSTPQVAAKLDQLSVVRYELIRLLRQ